MASSIDTSFIGTDNIDKASFKAALDTAKAEITALQNVQGTQSTAISAAQSSIDNFKSLVVPTTVTDPALPWDVLYGSFATRTVIGVPTGIRKLLIMSHAYVFNQNPLNNDIITRILVKNNSGTVLATNTFNQGVVSNSTAHVASSYAVDLATALSASGTIEIAFQKYNNAGPVNMYSNQATALMFGG